MHVNTLELCVHTFYIIIYSQIIFIRENANSLLKIIILLLTAIFLRQNWFKNWQKKFANKKYCFWEHLFYVWQKIFHSWTNIFDLSKKKIVYDKIYFIYRKKIVCDKIYFIHQKQKLFVIKCISSMCEKKYYIHEKLYYINVIKYISFVKKKLFVIKYISFIKKKIVCDKMYFFSFQTNVIPAVKS